MEPAFAQELRMVQPTPSLSRRLYWVATIAAFLVALGTAALLVFQMQTSAPEVNVAGRQRMLLQEMATEALEIANQEHHIARAGQDQAGHRAELEAAKSRLRNLITRFERAHRGLHQGWPEKSVDPITHTRCLELLAKVERYWQAYRENLKVLLSSEHASNAEVDRIAAQSQRLVGIMDRVVAALESRALERAQRQHRLAVGLIVALGILLLLAITSGWHTWRLERQALTDELTGLGNRARLDMRLADEVHRAERYGNPFAIAVFDLDHFKRINDEQGHPAGDRVLINVAQALREHVRSTDTVARWGGEELVVLMPETRLKDARRMADRVRFHVAQRRAPETPFITLSVGLAAWERGDTEESVFARADAALYRAKEGGRDQVATEPPLPSVAPP